MKPTTHNSANITTKVDWLQQWIPISLILLVATGLYLYQLGTESLWMDELISVDRAKPHNLDIWRTRPLYYLLLYVWMKFGSSDGWLRGLCVLFSLGSVFLTYRLGRRLIGESTGLIAAVIITLSPLLIHHAQEVRMYAPSTFLGLWGSLALSHALENPKALSIAWWVVLRWLAILGTPLTLLLLLPDIVLFGWRFRNQPRELFAFGKGLLAIGLLWSPWLITVATSSAKFMGGVKVPGTVPVNPVLKNKVSPNLISVLLQPGSFTAWSFGRPISNAIYWFYNAYCVMVACLLGFALFNKPRSNRLAWIAAWALLPLVPLFLVSQFSRPLWVNRYLLFTSPYLFILLAAGFLAVWNKWRVGSLVVALIYFIAVGGALKRYYTVLDNEDWRGLVETINKNQEPGDLIVWCIGQTIPRPLNHYYRGSATIEVRKRGPQATTEDDKPGVESWLNSLPKTQSRIWLVYAGPSPVFSSVLEEKFNVEARQKFEKADVFLLEPHSAPDQKK